MELPVPDEEMVNIKSNFFVRYLFSLMDDGKQLHLVKYNKSLQKILNINIMNYKFYIH